MVFKSVVTPADWANSRIPSSAWFAEYHAKVLALFDPTARINPPRIRIAIVDTGANIDRKLPSSMRSVIKDYRSWCDSTPGADGHSFRLPSGKFLDVLSAKDDVGHGTDIMKLLLDTAPCCDIYIAKVFESKRDMEQSHDAMATPMIISPD